MWLHECIRDRIARSCGATLNIALTSQRYVSKTGFPRSLSNAATRSASRSVNILMMAFSCSSRHWRERVRPDLKTDRKSFTSVLAAAESKTASSPSLAESHRFLQILADSCRRDY